MGKPIKFKAPKELSKSNWKERRDIMEQHTGKGWVRFRRDLLYFMSPNAAILFNYLAEKSAYFNADRLFNGWFYCTVERIHCDLNMSTDRQTRCLNEMKDLGVLLFAKKGLPAKRYLWIDWEKLAYQLIWASIKKDELLALYNKQENYLDDYEIT